MTAPLLACKDWILKPNRVFAQLREQQNWSWLPFFLVCIAAVLPEYSYFKQVDFEWYVNQLLSHQPDLTVEDIASVRQGLSRQILLTSALYLPPLLYILGNAVLAGYLYWVTRADELNTWEYGDWYGFTWWATLPITLNALVTLLILLLWGHPQLSPEYLQPLSVAFVAGVPPTSSWYGLAQSINLASIWSLYLVAVGIGQWTQLSARQCYFIAALPYCGIWVVWTLYLLL